METELLELLRELVVRSGARSVHVGSEPQPLAAGALQKPLGQGAYLTAYFEAGPGPRDMDTRLRILEQSTRLLRACMTRHGGTAWPTLQIPSAAPDRARLIAARIQQFLRGLVDTSALHQMVLMCRGQIVASAAPLDPLESDMLDLLSRQLDKCTPVGSNHGELARADVYALSFWYGAALFGFASQEYSLDFVRHRSKQVARELSHLLAMLEGGPDGPVKEAPDPSL